ncbi:hypothetical protein DJ021_13865 [Phenylobacterium hankyongense]|uniref:Uncharacterized protein n=1 Tax=Phenylobacterium hankyongense TaxID=1813876 RepID=A0A328B1Y7_9CAUL|nr:hypothetical protein [Phenylobacterium hankyongense]RAK60817.1 hypothetical protein DJ021_13865 [Phenylobacterium hankyongense]
MPRILITCPLTATPVSTGYRSPNLDLASMSGSRAFRCGCGAVHVWDARAAWAEQGLTPAAHAPVEMQLAGT